MVVPVPFDSQMPMIAACIFDVITVLEARSEKRSRKTHVFLSSGTVWKYGCHRREGVMRLHTRLGCREARLIGPTPGS